MNVLSLLHAHVYGRVKNITQGIECPHLATSGESLTCKHTNFIKFKLLSEIFRENVDNSTVLPLYHPNEMLNRSFKKNFCKLDSKCLTACCVSLCQHGSFQCDFRPCASMCTVYGDRHYRTFDGLLFDYVGDCKVYLLKVWDVDSLYFIKKGSSCIDDVFANFSI